MDRPPPYDLPDHYDDDTDAGHGDRVIAILAGLILLAVAIAAALLIGALS